MPWMVIQGTGELEALAESYRFQTSAGVLQLYGREIRNEFVSGTDWRYAAPARRCQLCMAKHWQ